MNVYGRTKCPKCNYLNAMYRPKENMLPVFDQVKCSNCEHEYKHSEILNKPVQGIKVMLIMFLVIGSHVAFCDNKITISYDDLAIKAIIGEAENQGYDGMLAVAGAIRNRGTLKGVYGLNNPRVKKGLYTKKTYLLARKAWLESAHHDTSLDSNAWENINAFGKPYWIDSCEERLTLKDHVFFKCPTT